MTRARGRWREGEGDEREGEEGEGDEREGEVESEGASGLKGMAEQ